ncbi:MAG: hypothetical protein N3A66_07905, partial [Planctomycetota bacterium]|nr:hypothetical protein [Planctomycetota bacterium]
WEKNREAIEKEGGPSWRPEPEGEGKGEKSEAAVSAWQPNEEPSPAANAADAAEQQPAPGSGRSAGDDEKGDKTQEPDKGNGEDGAKPLEKKGAEEKGEENPTSGDPTMPAIAEVYRSAPPRPKEAAASYGEVNIPGIPNLPRRPQSRRSGRFLLAEAGSETPPEMPLPAAPRSLPEGEPEQNLHPYAVTAETFEQNTPPDLAGKDKPSAPRPAAAKSAAVPSAASPEAEQPSRRRTFSADAYEQD